MKTITVLKFCIGLFLIAHVVLLVSGCESDPQSETKSEIALKKLTAKTWTLKMLTIDGVDKTSEYAGLELAFTATGVTATGGKLIWPANTSWAFTDDSATAIVRGDQVEVRLVELTESALEVELTWHATTFGGGRSKSLSGVYLFAFE